MTVNQVLVLNALQGFVTTSNPTYVNKTQNNLSLDTSGGLRVHIIASDIGGGGGTSSNFGSAFPSSGTAIGVKNGVNMVNLTADASSNLNVNIAASSGLTATVSGSVSVSNFPATQPVSGSVSVSNFPATQPVSGTVTTSPPSNASTNITQFGGNAVVTGTGVSGVGIPRVTVSSDSFPATQPISGSVSVSNFPATQAVTQSGTWTVQPGNTANTTAWKVDGSAVTQPVSGTVTANQGGAPWSENITQVGGVAVAATAKSTQGTNFVPVQDAKDSGRTYVGFTIDRIAGVTTEALATFTANKGGVNQAAGTTYTVTAGKTLRLQSMTTSIADTTTTAVNGRVRLRAVTSGTVVVTSPIWLASDIGSYPGTAAAGMGVGEELVYPDGVEIPGGSSVGISQILSSTSSTLSVHVVGYEY